jgi:hypothetical protein
VKGKEVIVQNGDLTNIYGVLPKLSARDSYGFDTKLQEFDLDTGKILNAKFDKWDAPKVIAHAVKSNPTPSPAAKKLLDYFRDNKMKTVDVWVEVGEYEDKFKVDTSPLMAELKAKGYIERTMGSKFKVLDSVSPNGEWHTRTMEAMRMKSEDQLRFIITDAREAAKAAQNLGNAAAEGKYLDEMHYASMELKRRKDNLQKDLKDLNAIAKKIEKAHGVSGLKVAQTGVGIGLYQEAGGGGMKLKFGANSPDQLKDMLNRMLKGDTTRLLDACRTGDSALDSAPAGWEAAVSKAAAKWTAMNEDQRAKFRKKLGDQYGTKGNAWMDGRDWKELTSMVQRDIAKKVMADASLLDSTEPAFVNPFRKPALDAAGPSNKRLNIEAILAESYEVGPVKAPYEAVAWAAGRVKFRGGDWKKELARVNEIRKRHGVIQVYSGDVADVPDDDE